MVISYQLGINSCFNCSTLLSLPYCSHIHPLLHHMHRYYPHLSRNSVSIHLQTTQPSPRELSTLVSLYYIWEPCRKAPNLPYFQWHLRNHLQSRILQSQNLCLYLIQKKLDNQEGWLFGKFERLIISLQAIGQIWASIALSKSLLSLKSFGIWTDRRGPNGTNAANKISSVTSFSRPPTYRRLRGFDMIRANNQCLKFASCTKYCNSLCLTEFMEAKVLKCLITEGSMASDTTPGSRVPG